MEAAAPLAAAECPGQHRRVLLCGWGAAAEEVLQELAAHLGGGRRVAAVLCVSHTAQAADCDLREASARFGAQCALTDSDEELLALARAFAPDLIVSASYRRRLPGSVLGLCGDRINFHPSLLPKHRGCWSGFWAIFEGDAETGVTCHRMVEEFDRGRILHQEHLAIEPSDTSFSLYRRLLPVTASCARQVFGLCFGDGLPAGREQEGPASYHYRKLPFGGLVQPDWHDDQVERFIRAMHFPPFDGAAVLIGGKRVLVDSLEDYQRLRQGAAECTAVAGSTAVAATAVTAAAVAAGVAAGVPMECAARSS